MSYDVEIRGIKNNETYMLGEFMYESIYQPNPSTPYPKDIIYIPNIRIYWDNWGHSKDDHCLVAIINNNIVGVVWSRNFHGEIKGYGFIDEDTPEIGIAIYKEYRNYGIGTTMMKQMLKYLFQKGYHQVSLSVSKGNPAINLYRRLGFYVVEENMDDFILVIKLSNNQHKLYEK